MKSLGLRAAMTLLALLGCLTSAKAIDVTVGDPESGQNSSYFPMYSYYNYSYTQQIYTASEIGASGTISSITLWLKGNESLPELSFDLYMKEVNKEVFASDADWVQLTEDEWVCSGTLTVHNEDFQTYTIDLDIPFTYSGTGNLLIGINNTTGNYKSGLYGMAFLTDDDSSRAICSYTDNSAYNPVNPPTSSNRLLNGRNVIMLDITASSIARPDMLTASDITGKGATLSWMGGSGQYNVEYKKADAQAWTLAKSNTALTSLPLYILEQNTSYWVRVQSVSGAEVSGWRTTSFTTPILYDAPANVKCTTTTATTATLSWEDDGTFEAWQVCLNDDESNLYDASSSTFTLTGLIEETIYTAKVRVVGDEGHGIWSKPISFEPTVKTVIGAGTNTSSSLPTHTFYNYSISQQIYTVDELGTAATIKSIDFYNTGSSVTRNLDIYIVSSNRSRFGGSSDWENVSEGDLVFSGLVAFEKGAWSTIELDTPFEYDGQHNVVLVVDDNTGNYIGSTSFRTFHAEDQAVYKSNDNTNFDPFSMSSGSVSDYKNQIRVMKVNPAIQQPHQLTASNISHSGADLSWTGTTSFYKVAIKKVDDDKWTYIGQVDETSFNFYDLDENTTYKVRVQAVQGSNASLWTATTFTTPYKYPAPTNLTYTRLTATSATLSWTENGTATAWQISQSGKKGYIEVNTNPYTMEGLTEDASYTVSVCALYGENATSLWSNDITFEPTDKQLVGYFTGSTAYLPAYASGSSLTQQLYTVAELGEAGTILSIDFFNTQFESTNTLDIYMMSTDKDGFSSGNNGVSVTGANLVFSGEVTFADHAWTTIPLDYPFYYDGQRNVVIVVHNKTGKSPEGTSFRAFNAPNQALYSYASSSDYTFDPTTSSGYSRSNVKNQIRLVKGEGSDVAKPENVTVSNITATAAKVNWTGGTGTYNVEYKKADEQAWTSVGTSISATSRHLYGLEQNASYQVRVQSVGTDGAFSNWTPNTFSTPILFEAPVNFTCTAVTANTATLSWEVSDNTNAWQICLTDDEGQERLTENITSKSYTVTGLTPEVVYSAKVRSVSEEGAGLWSESICVEPTAKLIVGYGTSTNDNLPTNTYCRFTMSQQIYTADELGTEATFESIDFFNTSSERTRTLDIYMVSTDLSQFASNYDWVIPTASDRVFRGEVNFAENGWTTITLNNAFEYDGESNVVLIIDDNTGSYSSSAYFRVLNAPRQTLVGTNDSYDLDPANPPVGRGAVFDSKNQIRLKKGDYPAAAKPQQLTVTNITPHSATISWRGKADRYQIQFRMVNSWLKYDNGKVKRRTNISSTGSSRTCIWGVKFKADQLTGNTLTKVAIYESVDNTSPITIKICEDYDSKGIAPKYDAPLRTVVVDNPEADNAFHEITLDEPLAITEGKALWITVETNYQNGQFVMSASQPSSVEAGTQWVKTAGSWKELGVYDQHYAGYAWMIRALMEYDSSINWPIPTVNNTRAGNTFEATDLDPETRYKFAVRGVSSDMKAKSSTRITSFTTLSELAAPNTLAVDNITHNSAELGWTGYQEKYNVRLKTVPELNTSAMGTFTQVGSDITTSWTPKPYTFDLSAYSGTGAIAIRHYNVTDMNMLAVDNISVTKANGETVIAEDCESGQMPADWICVDLDGDNQGWYMYQSGEGKYFAVSRSWNGSALRPDNWIIIPDVPMGGSLVVYARGLDRNWSAEVFGIYVSTSEDLFAPAVTKTFSNIAGSTHTLENLKPMTTYRVQVQGVHDTEGNTSWSTMETFTTSFLRGDVNASGDVTPADAIMILYNYFGVEQTGFIEKAADLNGDGSITPADAIEALYLYFGASSSSGGAGARATTPTTIDVREPE